MSRTTVSRYWPLARVRGRLFSALIATGCSIATSPVSRGSDWIHDGSDRAPRLEVEQAIWAMGALPRDGEQVQIDIGTAGDSADARRFTAWWKQAMVCWLRQAAPGDVFVFRSELGPPSYSIVDADGRELSDRWAQALVTRDLGIRTWNEAVAEAGHGEPYAAVPASEALPAGLLDPEESKYFPIRGACYRLGKDYFLSGQLAQPDFDFAKADGVVSVILVRLDNELGGLGFEPEPHIRGLGMHYVHFPIAPATMSDEVAAKFVQTLTEIPKPVIIVDSNGNRAWGLWALYLGARWGVPVDEVAAVAAKVDVDKLVIDGFVRGYLERRRE